MAADQEGALVAVIADEDTITGFLLAGVGDVDIRKRSNFLLVDSKTTVRTIEAAFKDFTSRDDIAIILISQPIANMIRNVVANYTQVSGCMACLLNAACQSLRSTWLAIACHSLSGLAATPALLYVQLANLTDECTSSTCCCSN